LSDRDAEAVAGRSAHMRKGNRGHVAATEVPALPLTTAVHGHFTP